MPQPVFAQHAEHLDAVLKAVLDAADPARALARAWERVPAEEQSRLRGAVLLAAGKGSIAMARAAVDDLGVRPASGAGSGGVVVAPAGSRAPACLPAAGLRIFEADHPLPTQRNMIAAQALADAARLASSRRLPVLVLLSGGASAHLTLPERGLTLSDVRAVTDALLKAGAPIDELNAVRKRIEALKGGGLARLAAPSPVHVFVLSDVPGDRVDVIASGPCADDHTTDQQALGVVVNRAAEAHAPNVAEHLRKRLKAQSMNMGGPPRPAVTNATHTVIGSNAMAVDAARRELERLGFVIDECRTGVAGEAATAGRELAARLLAGKARNQGPTAVLWGGETTVCAAQPAAGPAAAPAFGGRNQEAALAAATVLAGHAGVALACFATDGVDGTRPPAAPRPHAGALVTGDTMSAARRANLSIQSALDAHDSFALCAAAGVALKPGPTGTNVNDVWIGLAY